MALTEKRLAETFSKPLDDLDLLRDLIERGLATDRALLFVLDGSKALSA